MNFDALLAPISEASPCGDDLSFSIDFDAIQELRRADDPTLDQGEWVTALKQADWPEVVKRCTTLLSERTKDLRIAAWLTDASARVDGYAGLADGLTLCRLLCERYWQTLHPRLDDDGDAEPRNGNLRWLLAQVEALTPRLPVLQSSVGTYSLQEMEAARTPSLRHSETEETAAGAHPITAGAIAAARQATPREFLAANFAEARRARQALDQLRQSIDAHLGNDGPAFAGATDVLDAAVHATGLLARDNAALDDASAGQAPDAALLPSAGAVAMSSSSLRTRADALRQLRAVADFFRHSEPHSPVAYLAERAAKWGEMPLHTWLRTVVKDPGALSQMEELLGVAPLPGAAE